MYKYGFVLVWFCCAGFTLHAQSKRFPQPELLLKKANGFRGIWYMNQPSHDEYVYKYSGGLGTYPANHRPFALYSKRANKTFFVYGGTDESNSTLLHCVSYFDHKTGKVANPVMLLDKKTTDAHDNPVISMDDKGYLWIFSTAHGLSRPSYIHKSRHPYDITDFVTIQATEETPSGKRPFDNFSYFQVYHIKGKGFFALFTKYNTAGHRVIGFSTSKDGVAWGAWQPLAHIEQGHYQISCESNGKIGVAFDYHPAGKGLNYRTNLHYLETKDFGKSWQTVTGQHVILPLTAVNNPALIKDFAVDRHNCYLLDISFDRKQNPAILVISSKGFEAGPENGPRKWRLFRFMEGVWHDQLVTTSDNNYDMGSVYVESGRKIRVIGPTVDGPQAFNPGGEIAIWTSRNAGERWDMEKQLTANSPMNHTYLRKPREAHPDFYGLWADGHGRKPSASYLYFMTKSGKVFRLPRNGSDELITPEPVK